MRKGWKQEGGEGTVNMTKIALGTRGEHKWGGGRTIDTSKLGKKCARSLFAPSSLDPFRFFFFLFGEAMSKTDGSFHAFTVSCSQRRERESERERKRTMHPFEMKRPMPYRDDRGGEWLEETDVLLRPTSGRGAQVLHYTQGGGTEGRAAGGLAVRCQIPMTE